MLYRHRRNTFRNTYLGIYIHILDNLRQRFLSLSPGTHEFEQLKVFKSLPKEQWKSAYNELNKVIGTHLKPYGFKKKGRKHYRLTNDLLEVIDVDNRGSWNW